MFNRITYLIALLPIVTPMAFAQEYASDFNRESCTFATTGNNDDDGEADD